MGVACSSYAFTWFHRIFLFLRVDAGAKIAPYYKLRLLPARVIWAFVAELSLMNRVKMKSFIGSWQFPRLAVSQFVSKNWRPFYFGVSGVLCLRE